MSVLPGGGGMRALNGVENKDIKLISIENYWVVMTGDWRLATEAPLAGKNRIIGYTIQWCCMYITEYYAVQSRFNGVSAIPCLERRACMPGCSKQQNT